MSKKSGHWRRGLCSICRGSVPEDKLIGCERYEKSFLHAFCPGCVWSGVHAYTSGRTVTLFSSHAHHLYCNDCVAEIECYIVREANIELLPLLISVRWVSPLAALRYKTRMESL